MNFAVARTLTAAVMVLLAGCAAFTTGERVPAAQPFDILGRVLASSEGRAFSANFRWRHMTENEIWLMSPAGQTLAHIATDANGATLTTADQKEYRSFSVESLTRDALGWPLPLARLQYWVRGELVPGRAFDVMRRDGRDRLAYLEQDGWTIRYAYPETADYERQPRRLEMMQDSQRIRMVIDEWRTQSP